MWENIQPPTPLPVSLFDLTDFGLENEQPIVSQETSKAELNPLQKPKNSLEYIQLKLFE